MKIYTKTGDHGQTSLLYGQRVQKSDPRIELLGTLDEFNSVLGLAVSLSQNVDDSGKLERTQRQVFELGAELANADSAASKLSEHAKAWIAELEREIDELTERLPALKNFILPGGSQDAAAVHLARSVCRRAERLYFAQPSPAREWIGVYLNRLGDWLFVLARRLNQIAGKSETIWKSSQR
jgi:cob(I)alamin adenosyltransferase